MHATPWGGHSCIIPTQQRLRSLFYWPGLLSDVKEVVRSCEIYQRNKGEVSHWSPTTTGNPYKSMGACDYGFYRWASKITVKGHHFSGSRQVH